MGAAAPRPAVFRGPHFLIRAICEIYYVATEIVTARLQVVLLQFVQQIKN